MPAVRPLTPEGRREKLAKDFSYYIKRQMQEQKISQQRLGEALDMSQAGASYAIRNMTLNYRQLLIIFDTIHADPQEVVKYLSTERN